jgi:archaeosine synthase
MNTPRSQAFSSLPGQSTWKNQMVQSRNTGAPGRVVGVVQDRHGNLIEIFDPPFYRKEFEDAYRFIIDDYPVAPREIGLFLPCAVRKPYSQSPSHKLFRRIIDAVLDPGDYHIVIFGTCGTVPAELEGMYPYANYHYMLGKTTDTRIRRDFHRIEVHRLKGYLEKTRDTYRRRLAYCIGPFRAAMVEASEETGIAVDLLPSDPMIERLYDIDCPFPEGSLSMQGYIDEFREGLARLARSLAGSGTRTGTGPR